MKKHKKFRRQTKFVYTDDYYDLEDALNKALKDIDDENVIEIKNIRGDYYKLGFLIFYRKEVEE